MGLNENNPHSSSIWMLGPSSCGLIGGRKCVTGNGLWSLKSRCHHSQLVCSLSPSLSLSLPALPAPATRRSGCKALSYCPSTMSICRHASCRDGLSLWHCKPGPSWMLSFIRAALVTLSFHSHRTVAKTSPVGKALKIPHCPTCPYSALTVIWVQESGVKVI